MDDVIKAEKEAFVSNNDGTSIEHVIAVLLVVPVSESRPARFALPRRSDLGCRHPSSFPVSSHP